MPTPRKAHLTEEGSGSRPSAYRNTHSAKANKPFHQADSRLSTSQFSTLWKSASILNWPQPVCSDDRMSLTLRISAAMPCLTFKCNSFVITTRWSEYIVYRETWPWPLSHNILCCILFKDFILCCYWGFVGAFFQFSFRILICNKAPEPHSKPGTLHC